MTSTVSTHKKAVAAKVNVLHWKGPEGQVNFPVFEYESGS